MRYRVDYLTLRSNNAMAERGVLFDVTKYTFDSIQQVESKVLESCKQHGEVLETLTVMCVAEIGSQPCDCRDCCEGANNGNG